MRILIGKDYYDSALAYGRDEDITFVRDRDWFMDASEFPVRITPVRFGVYAKVKNDRTVGLDLRRNHLFTLYPINVVFCDKYYCGIELYPAEDRYTGVRPPPTFHWSHESFEAALNKLNCTTNAKEERSRWGYLSRKIRRWEAENRETERSAPHYFSEHRIAQSHITEMIDQGIVLAVYRGYTQQWDRNTRWQVNSDNLKEVEFYRRLDAYAAFQEISMWVGGWCAAACRCRHGRDRRQDPG